MARPIVKRAEFSLRSTTGVQKQAERERERKNAVCCSQRAKVNFSSYLMVRVLDHRFAERPKQSMHCCVVKRAGAGLVHIAAECVCRLDSLL